MASTTLLIGGSQGATPISIPTGTDTPAARSQTYYQTQYAILKSRALAAVVIQEEGLANEPVLAGQQSIGIIGRLWASTKQLWKSHAGAEDALAYIEQEEASDSPAKSPASLTLTDTSPDLVRTYQALLDVQPVQHTRLVSISFRTPDPILSARLANAHAKAYLNQEWQLHTDWADEAQEFLSDKLTDLRERIQQTEAAYQPVAAERGQLDERELEIVTQWAAARQQLSEAEAERLLLEVQVYLGHRGAFEALADISLNEDIQAMNAELQGLEKDYAQRLTQLDSAETERASREQLQAALDETHQRLVQVVQQQVRGLGDAYQAAVAREAALGDSLQQYEAEKLNPASPAIRAALVEHQLAAQRWLFDTVQQQLQTLGTQAPEPAIQAVVLDAAKPPRDAVNPRGSAPLVFGAVIGLIGSVGLSCILEFFDNSLQTPQDVESTLQLTPLSLMPDFDAHRSPLQVRSGLSLEERGCLLSERTFPEVTEAYQTLQAALRRCRPTQHASTILFTSPAGGEGKTLTVCHIGLLLAQAGHKVLVIDADGRCSDCRTLFGIDECPGLIELVTGKRKQRVVKKTSVANLFFLASGRWSVASTEFKDFAELLASPQTVQLLSSLQGRYEYILIDTPPILAGNEAIHLSAAVEHIVLVVDGQRSTKDIARQAQGRLAGNATKLSGVVLTKVDQSIAPV